MDRVTVKCGGRCVARRGAGRGAGRPAASLGGRAPRAHRASRTHHARRAPRLPLAADLQLTQLLPQLVALLLALLLSKTNTSQYSRVRLHFTCGNFNKNPSTINHIASQ